MKSIIYNLIFGLLTLSMAAQTVTITNYINKNDMKAIVQEGIFLWTAADGGIVKLSL